METLDAAAKQMEAMEQGVDPTAGLGATLASPTSGKSGTIWRWNKKQKEKLEQLWLTYFKTDSGERRRTSPTVEELAVWRSMLQDLDPKRPVPDEQPNKWFSWALQESDPNRRHDLKKEQKDAITVQLGLGTVSVLSPIERFRELQEELERVIPVCHRPSEKVVRDWVAKLAAEAVLQAPTPAPATEGAEEGGDGAAAPPPSLDAQVAAFRDRYAGTMSELEEMFNAVAQTASVGGDVEYLTGPGVLTEKRERLAMLKAQAMMLKGKKGDHEQEMKDALVQISQHISRLQKTLHPPARGSGGGSDMNSLTSAKRSRRKAEEQPTDNRALSRFLSNCMASLRRKLTRMASWAHCDVALYVRFSSRRAGAVFGASSHIALSDAEVADLDLTVKTFFERVQARREAEAAAGGVMLSPPPPPSLAEIEAADREEAGDDMGEGAYDEAGDGMGETGMENVEAQ